MTDTFANRCGENALREILDQSPYAVYVNALDTWELLYCNETAKIVMNKQPISAQSTCFSLMGFDRPCPYCRIEKMTRDKMLSREFYHPILKRTFLLNGKIIDWNGRLAHIEFIADITERKRADDENRALSEELLSVLKNVPGGLCVYRFDGKKITPVFHNDDFYRILGYSDEHIFQTLEQTENLNVHPDDLQELNRKIFQAIRAGGETHHIYRVFNDKLGEYRWIRLDGSVKHQKDGTCMLYGIYTDVNDQHNLERRLAEESARTQSIINAIPGGVAIYKIGKELETVYFSDGVAELTGYSPEEYRKLRGKDIPETLYCDDLRKVIEAIESAVATDRTVEIEYRKRHRDGHLVWVHVQAKKIGEENGATLVQCVFHNITELKEAQQELDHMVNSIPGGIAVYRVADGKFKTKFYTDGVAALTGHTRAEYTEIVGEDSFNIVFDKDKRRIRNAVDIGMKNGSRIELSYRRMHKDGHPVWVHLSGKCTGDVKNPEIYAVYTGMSAETKLYQNIANETADGIYVIDANNYDLLYANESVRLFMEQESNPVGKKCYAALHGKSAPCEFCTLAKHAADGQLHEMQIPGSDRKYSTRFRETDWNGIPAYIKYVSDVTEEDRVRRQKAQLEQYFQTMVKLLPGGVAVVHYDTRANKTIPEFISEGFVAMCGMTMQEAWQIYESDACMGVHPNDLQTVTQEVQRHLNDPSGTSFELVYRLRRHDGSYFWVKNTSTLIRYQDGSEPRIYSTYSDITDQINEQKRMRDLYNDMLFQHHRSKDPNLILAGHCSLTAKRVIQITDKTDSGLLDRFGSERDAFFTGLSEIIVDESERQAFLNEYLTAPLLEAFQRGENKHESDYFIQLPDEQTGRYVHLVVNLIKSPDTGDVMGILSMLDYTERRVSEKILHRLARTNYDFIGDIDLYHDQYKLISYDKSVFAIPNVEGSYSEQALRFLNSTVVPKDRAICERKLDPAYIKRKLADRESFSFHYTIVGENGETFTKNMIVFYIDKRLQRICLARTDISDSVREQRQLLNILAYTFDLACFIEVSSRSFTMHSRDTVLQNLAPYSFDSYDETSSKFTAHYGTEEDRKEIRKQFELDFMVKRLAENPMGYEFTFSLEEKGKIWHKQVNVLWGDENRRTICMVRADVTEVLNAEQRTKEHLKNALNIAQEANRAKTDFLSAMSHDIRTPMNAIVGMTDLAMKDRDNSDQIDESLSIIKNSSEHLLRLINDILDMSRIESGKMVLSKEPFSHAAELEKVVARAQALADRKNLKFRHSIDIRHNDCIGDAVRIQQILDNLIGNAVKFTPEGGEIALEVIELPQKNDTIGWYRYIVSDTGIGIDAESVQRIFEPFYRVGSPRLQRIEGTGLGLSIVKSIVDYKGGIMNVESRPDHGSRFLVDIPIHFAQATVQSHEEDRDRGKDEAEDLAGAHILLVEDHPINQLVATKILERMHARVTIAENGEEGLRLFLTSEEDQYDAICMDIQMPVMDGYESAVAIRACDHPRAKSVPIIAMTANAFAGDVKKCLDVGMNAHIAKPIESGKLYRVLKNELSKR